MIFASWIERAAQNIRGFRSCGMLKQDRSSEGASMVRHVVPDETDEMDERVKSEPAFKKRGNGRLRQATKKPRLEMALAFAAIVVACGSKPAVEVATGTGASSDGTSTADAAGTTTGNDGSSTSADGTQGFGSSGSTGGSTGDGGRNDVELSAGKRHALVRRASGDVSRWRWPRPAPSDVPELPESVEISAGGLHACARFADGHVACWGEDSDGQLGDGSLMHDGCHDFFQSDACSSIPVAVVGITDAVAIDAGDRHTCAVSATGTISCWGDAPLLGDGVADHGQCRCSTVPVEVVGIDDAIAVSAGGLITCALRASGAVEWWGFPAPGATDVPSPVAGVEEVVQLSVGWAHACAVTSDGRVVCWGLGGFGQLGDGTPSWGTPSWEPHPPRFVPGVSDAVEVAAGQYHTCARRDSGATICWGANYSLQLGDGVAEHQLCDDGEYGLDCSPVPVEVVGLSDAVELAAGADHTCARTTDETVVCWGEDIATPTQVPLP